MAKKKTAGSDTPSSQPAASARRRTRRPAPVEPAAAPVDLSNVTRVEPIEMASDMAAHAATPAGEAAEPSYHDIAEEAYRRYMRRGRIHGRDFEDWLEAERELRARQSR